MCIGNNYKDIYIYMNSRDPEFITYEHAEVPLVVVASNNNDRSGVVITGDLDCAIWTVRSAVLWCYGKER